MSFAQFSAQERVVNLLQRSLERGRLSHAYLFGGIDLEELQSVARTLAKALNCENPVRRPGVPYPSDCCDRCSSCRKTEEELHPDVHWVRPESKSRLITIDQIRGLMQAIALKPTQSSWKTAVIVAADRLNVQAANAFLKTLEEPPTRSAILLLTTDPGRLFETIISRCLRLSFAGESKPQLRDDQLDWLRAFGEMAVTSEGGLLGRYRLLGTLLRKLSDVKKEVEQVLTARSPLERHRDVDPRLRDRWEDELAASVEAEYRRRRAELLLALQWWLRDVWLRTQCVGGDLLSIPELGQAAERVAGRISLKQALDNIEVLEQTQWLLGSNVQEALALEVGLLKLKL